MGQAMGWFSMMIEVQESGAEVREERREGRRKDIGIGAGVGRSIGMAIDIGMIGMESGGMTGGETGTGEDERSISIKANSCTCNHHGVYMACIDSYATISCERMDDVMLLEVS